MSPRWQSAAIAGLLAALGTAALAQGGAPTLPPRPAASAPADAEAKYQRALALLCGARGGPRNPQAAAKLLREAAEQGHVGAQGLYGWMAMSGVGMARDDKLAGRWLRPAAEAGDTAAQNNLGVLYAIGSGVPHDHRQAERWFRAAAAQGAEDAENNLKELLRPLPPAPASGSAPATPTRVRQTAKLHPALAAAGCRPLPPRV